MEKITNFSKNFAKKVAIFFKNLVHSIQNKIKSFFGKQKEIIVNGNHKTRLSYLFMGYGNATQGQIIKGILFFLVEILFILIMVFFSAKYLVHIGTLGEVAVKTVIDADGFEKNILFHESHKILLFSVFSIIIIICMFFIYIATIKSAYNCQKLRKEGKKPLTFKQEMNTFLNERYHISLLTFPALGVIIFTIVPLIFMMLIAFTNYDGLHSPPGNLFTWVGLENFAKLLDFKNGTLADTFWSTLGWTLIWAFFATFTNFFFGVLLALLLNKKGLKGKKIYRTIFVLTIAVPQFVSLLLISQLLAKDGALNAILLKHNIIGSYIKFLDHPTGAKATVIIVNMWVGIPYTMLITSGLLMNIPEDMYESAEIDGAKAHQKFRYITIPHILFATGPYLITQFVGNINNFNVIYLLTGGGPSSQTSTAGKTDLLVTWLFKITIDSSSPDYKIASVIGIVIFMLTASLSLIVFKYTTSKNEGGY